MIVAALASIVLATPAALLFLALRTSGLGTRRGPALLKGGAVVTDVADGTSLFRSVEIGGERGFAYYVFLNDKLSYVEVLLAGSDADEMRALLEEKYGEPTGSSLRGWEWVGPNGQILLVDDPMTTITYADPATYESAKRERQAAAQRKADEEKAKKLKSL